MPSPYKIYYANDVNLRLQICAHLDELYGIISGGGPLITKWPIIKTSIESGETFTVLAGYQMLLWNYFTIDGGDLTVDGDMILIEAP